METYKTIYRDFIKVDKKVTFATKNRPDLKDAAYQGVILAHTEYARLAAAKAVSQLV